ncbi:MULTISPECIES: hypothetical protein [unclassified Burkholderia]|uniref:hypothetical protein n=1 Tax=unclassified Burkholderia TaxID=2613784 RepID=UPI002AAF90CE|nr:MULTISPECIES: hypothetical protein [unclassified Burkholderia]
MGKSFGRIAPAASRAASLRASVTERTIHRENRSYSAMSGCVRSCLISLHENKKKDIWSDRVDLRRRLAWQPHAFLQLHLEDSEDVASDRPAAFYFCIAIELRWYGVLE